MEMLSRENSVNTYYDKANNTAWDSDKIYGCLCDSNWAVGYGYGETRVSEWFGADCSQRNCPSGDDPMTSLVETDCSNVQISAGTYTGSLNGSYTGLLNGTAGLYTGLINGTSGILHMYIHIYEL
jgi:hypothetical protein